MRRRLARIVVIATVAGLVSSLGASAAAGELEDRLQRAHDAEYSGRQLVLTTWNDQSALDAIEIQRLGGVTALVGPDGEALVGGGRVQGPSGSAAVTNYTAAPGAQRYEMRGPEPDRYLGRAAEAVEVFEGGTLRARILFDVETGAPLSTEVFDADGERFRVAYMLSFSPKTTVPIPLVDKLEGEYDVLLPIDPSRLAATVAGYSRADAYEAQDGTVHAFYSDGLFSFSVFELGREAPLPESGDLVRFEADGTDYRAVVDPAEITVIWSAEGRTYVLMGDLPPDHLERALDELPKESSLLSRLWRGLFG